MLDSCRSQDAKGFEVTYLPLKTNGLVDLGQLEDAIRPDTSLVSIMTVNNKFGVHQPVQDIVALCKEKKLSLHIYLKNVLAII